MILLSPLDLSIAAVLVLALAASTWSMGLGVNLSQRMLVAAVRTTIQLSLIGIVLKAVFDQAAIVWIAIIATTMLLVAAYEVSARQSRRFRRGRGYGIGLVAMSTSSFSVTLLALLVIIRVQPWYTPQYAIPLLGMLLGNTMNGIALAVDRLTQSAWQQRGVIEARLLMGQDWRQAIGDIRQEAMRVGMIPIINAMAAAGVVSLPGMMTGQILAGSPPLEAVKYQILIMFLITTGTGFGTIVAVSLAARHLFDDRHRLRLDRLGEKKL